MGRSRDEFPLLAACNLQVVNTQGNGNCLFHALSDQLYGDQSHHKELRARVIEYMRENAEWYKSFLSVNSGGGTRRNPKRKNAGAFASTVASNAPTQEEIDSTFEKHLDEMARGGTYGDNMELNAFSNAFGVDIKIWHPEGLPWLSAAEANTHDGRILHIALHSYEHYSSVRNVGGPHTGLPEVKDPETYDPAAVEGRKKTSKRTTSGSVELAPWKIKVVQNSLPYLAETDVINSALIKHDGDVDDAVSYLIEHEDGYSVPSSPGSSSIERDQDAEDEAEYATGSRKKQDRRQSRATKQKLSTEALTHRPKTIDGTATSATATTSTTNTTDEPESPDPYTSPRRSRRPIIEDSEDEAVESEKTSTDSEASPAPPSIAIIAPTEPEKPNIVAKSTVRTRSTSRAPVAAAKVKQKPGPKPKVSASMQKDLKKRAQKAAAKERKQGLNNGKPSTGNALSTVNFTKGRQSPPVAGIGSLLI